MGYSVRDLLLLLKTPQLGRTRIVALTEIYNSIDEILNSSKSSIQTIDGFGAELSKDVINNIKKTIADSEIQDFIDKQMQLVEDYDAKAITFQDPDYPVNLREVFDKPVVLFCRGKLEESDELSLAIVGSRSISEYGSLTTTNVSRELASKGFTIVSGLAAGIDTLAHKGCLEAGGRTIAVLGTGLDIVFPSSNKDLYFEIIENGAVMTEYFFGTPSLPQNFPARNRIISGLTLGTLVVEAQKKSGSLITARCALEQNREVFAVPGNISNTKSDGTNRLIRDSAAKLVLTADDILQEFKDRLVYEDVEEMDGTDGANSNSKENSTNKKKSSRASKPIRPKGLSDLENKILDTLSGEPIQVDKLSRDLGLPITQLMTTLLMLELKGLVQKLSGNKFVLG